MVWLGTVPGKTTVGGFASTVESGCAGTQAAIGRKAANIKVVTVSSGPNLKDLQRSCDHLALKSAHCQAIRSPPVGRRYRAEFPPQHATAAAAELNNFTLIDRSRSRCRALDGIRIDIGRKSTLAQVKAKKR